MSSDNPKVSVVMSVYNGEKYLKEAMDSVLSQTFQDFEFIIVNDGSTDKTGEILSSYNDSRLVILHQENRGLTKSLNKGLRVAKGEYIARQDADDISLPERLEREVKFLDQNQSTGLVGTYYSIISKNGKVLHTVKHLTEGRELKEKLLEENQFCHGSVMLRTECVERVGLYREEFKSAQDYDLWLRISELYDVANIPEPLYRWRFDVKSMTISKKAYQDRYAEFARELAKERRRLGRDKLQNLSKREIDKVMASLLQKVKPKNRRELAKLYCSLGRSCIDGKECVEALKLLSRSLVNYPFNNTAWILILEVLILLVFPKSAVNGLRFAKRYLSTYMSK